MRTEGKQQAARLLLATKRYRVRFIGPDSFIEPRAPSKREASARENLIMGRPVEQAPSEPGLLEQALTRPTPEPGGESSIPLTP